ncbi:MAG TPA: dockerin type I domain-containing protein [Isosphaeraceae bacterium]
MRSAGLTFGQATGLAELVASVNDADATNDRIRLVFRGLDGSANVGVSLAGRLTALDAALEVDFGAAGITGNATSTAGDGYYEFWLDLDGDGMFDAVRRFHRLLGDGDGSGQVDDADAQAISLALGQAGAGLAADVNGDGYVTAADRTLARRQAGRKLTGGLAIDA